MQDGCNICMDTYMASNGSCVHGHLYYFKIDLTQNQETIALRMLTTVHLLYLSCVKTHMNKISLKQHLIEGRAHVTSHYT
jgi:hypothetical protein